MAYPMLQSISTMTMVGFEENDILKHSFFFTLTVVYLYFLQRELRVQEDDCARICLELQEADNAIKADIWVNFATSSHSAIG